MPPEPRSVVEQRARDFIDFPAELTTVEFKRNGPFESMQFRIAKTAMAMANLRDGGMIIIGVAQDDARNFVVEGVQSDSEATFSQEAVYEFVNSYASPPVELRVTPMEHRGLRFVTIDVWPFERTPVVCQRNTPDGTRGNDQMHVGDFFVRTGDIVGTRRVTSAAMLHEIIEFAVIRRLAEIQRILGAAGIPSGAPSPFDTEVSDLGDAF